jgi:two-component system, NarL family, sensor kinase
MKKRVDLLKAENTLLPMVKKNCLYFLLTTMVLIFSVSMFCQTPVADSLLKLLPYEKNDSIRIAMLRDIGFDYYRTNAVKSTRYLKEAIALAKQTNNTYQYFGAWMDYGSLKIDMGQYDSAAIIFKRLLSEPFAETNYRMKAAALSNLATVYLDQDKYVEAEQYYLQAIAIYEKNHTESQLVISYGNICFIYTDLKQYQHTIDYANKLYSLAKKNDDLESLVVSLGFLASSYTRLGQPEKSFPLLKEALELSLKQENPNQRFELYSDLGEYYIAVKDYDKAIVHLTKADSIAKKLTNSRHRGSNLALLGKAYTLKSNYTKAREVLQEAALVLAGNGKLNERRELYLTIAETEKKMGNDGKAYDYLYKYAELKDTIYSEATSAKIAELEINYQTEKKENDILKLQQESKIKTDSIQKSRMFSYILLGSLLTLLLIGFLSYRTYKQKQLLQQQQIKQLQSEKLLLATESILKGQEDERSRLAQDLHDGLGGMLSGVKLTLSAMKGNIILSEQNGRLFTKAFEQLDSSIGEMRRVAHNMMPEALVKLGLQQALQDYCDGINEIKKINIKCEFHGLQNRLDNTTEIIIYRIVQELLNNIIKHANAHNVLVQAIKKDTELNITVEDDGDGFDNNKMLGGKGAGLKNIQSRIDYLKGELDIKSTPGKGTSVHINCNI